MFMHATKSKAIYLQTILATCSLGEGIWQWHVVVRPRQETIYPCWEYMSIQHSELERVGMLLGDSEGVTPSSLEFSRHEAGARREN